MPKMADEVNTNIALPRELRQRIDELRLDRARRRGSRQPTVKAVIVEALLGLLRRQGRGRKVA